MILDILIGEYKYDTVIFSLCFEHVNFKAVFLKLI